MTPLSTTRQLSTDPAKIAHGPGRFSHASETMCTDVVRGAAGDDGERTDPGGMGGHVGLATSRHGDTTGRR
ncbi:hypothetical protein ACFQ0G_17705 [Streptomyces chiangmaiensis]